MRAACRVFLLTLWTSAMFCLFVFLRFFTKRWFVHTDVRLRSAVVRLWARVALRIGGVRVTMHGTPPRHPCFTVSNHLSSIDSVVVCAAIGGIFVARHDVAQWPLIGFLTRCIDIIFVNRQRRREVGDINQQIANALEQGYAVHMFAESRIGDGKSVLPFKPALLEPAVQAGIPVHYATIGYRTKPKDPPPMQSIHWGPDVSFAKHLLDILRLRGAEVTMTFGEEAITGGERKQLAYALWEKVRSQFTPLD
ncbi:MAG: lysophospholipid acyltransferase family protein [Candidatus Hydrogenedentes bacterium]|nr:lysophospholipid acyltransferase family protein [Candidatus Hydrogenedentota bacterium]